MNSDTHINPTGEAPAPAICPRHRRGSHGAWTVTGPKRRMPIASEYETTFTQLKGQFLIKPKRDGPVVAHRVRHRGLRGLGDFSLAHDELVRAASFVTGQHRAARE